MPASLATIQALRTVLGRLNAERPAARVVDPERTQYVARGGDFQSRLDLEIVSRQGKARVLVTGQIGVGKSSELWNFYHRGKSRKDLGFIVYCDLEKEEHPEYCSATAVLLTILRDCWAASRPLRNAQAQSRRIREGWAQSKPIRDEILNRLIDWLVAERSDDGSHVVFRFGGMDFRVSLEEQRRDEALALILGKAAQHEAVSQPSERLGAPPDSLLTLLNRLLDWMKAQWHNRAPILIVDHVDKIRNPAAAEDVLLKTVPQWNRLRASIVMTAPFEYTLGELRHSVQSRWGHPLMLYPLEIPDADEGEIPAIYCNIAQNAGLGSLIDQASLRLLAHYSGGIPRMFVQFLVEAAKEAHFAQHTRIEPADARRVIHQAERAYQDYGVDELELLDKIDQTETGLGEAATLLRSPIGLLVATPEDGEQRLRVHPLAARALERFRARHGVPS